MKAHLIAVLMVLAMVGHAQTDPTPPSMATVSPAKVDFTPELADVTAQLKQKFDAGQTNAADLAENLQSINGLIAKYWKTGDRDELARLYLLDAHIYADGMHDQAKARLYWETVARTYPGTTAARGATLSLERLDTIQAELNAKVPEGLEVGQRFPGFKEMDVLGKPLSLAAYRGRVTMVDFWATWCGPCKGEMPNVIATYQRFHARGFDIIGVSLDSDRGSLLNFIQTHGMPWAQYFDGLAWQNKLAGKYGVQSIPMDYLLDRHGVILGKELRGEDLPIAVAKALESN